MAKIKAWWTGLSGEFKKIIWPNKASVVRQTVVVVIITVIAGVIISLLDNVIQLGLDAILK